MWSDSPRQPKESSDDERSYSRVLCCLQNTRWVWFVGDGFAHRISFGVTQYV